MAEQQTISGCERAAIFLMSLSEQAAAEIMKHMPVSEVQKVGQAMATLRGVSRSEADQVLGSFTSNVESQAPLVGSSPQFLKRLLSKSLGEEHANTLLNRLVEGKPTGLDSLHMMDAKEISEIILREHPQVVAIVLAGLDSQKAAEVIVQLPSRMATDIISRIGKMEEVPQSAIADLDEVMRQRFSQSSGFKVTEMGGVRTAAEILNIVDKDLEQKIIADLDENDPPLSQEIQENMFVFENLLDADDKGIQSLVREITSEILITALKGADESMRDKIFRNMSKRAAELLQSDLEAKGPVRITDVEEAQKQVVAAARQLADDGNLILGSAGNDYV